MFLMTIAFVDRHALQNFCEIARVQPYETPISPPPWFTFVSQYNFSLPSICIPSISFVPPSCPVTHLKYDEKYIEQKHSPIPFRLYLISC